MRLQLHRRRLSLHHRAVVAVWIQMTPPPSLLLMMMTMMMMMMMMMMMLVMTMMTMMTMTALCYHWVRRAAAPPPVRPAQAEPTVTTAARARSHSFQRTARPFAAAQPSAQSRSRCGRLASRLAAWY